MSTSSSSYEFSKDMDMSLLSYSNANFNVGDEATLLLGYDGKIVSIDFNPSNQD